MPLGSQLLYGHARYLRFGNRSVSPSYGMLWLGSQASQSMANILIVEVAVPIRLQVRTSEFDMLTYKVGI